MAGVAYNASLMVGKVLGDDGVGTISTVANGITWAADNGAKVISMSLGADIACPASLQDAVSYAWSKGVVIVAATGNDGISRPNTRPTALTPCRSVRPTRTTPGPASPTTALRYRLPRRDDPVDRAERRVYLDVRHVDGHPSRGRRRCPDLGEPVRHEQSGRGRTTVFDCRSSCRNGIELGVRTHKCSRSRERLPRADHSGSAAQSLARPSPTPAPVNTCTPDRPSYPHGPERPRPAPGDCQRYDRDQRER